MFSKAFQTASKFTFPVFISTKYFDGSVEVGMASFVIVNPEGWVLTCAHIFETEKQAALDRVNIDAYKAEVELINLDPDIKLKHKKEKIDKIKRNLKWITDQSYYWSMPGVAHGNRFTIDPNDLVLVKLTNYDPNFCDAYPKFKRPIDLIPGTSLCKLGYPFYKVKATYDDSLKAFTIEVDPFELKRFPMDGIFTRDVIKTLEGQSDPGRFIETSTPGLRGQSGGPIFDVHGNIWAIQSQVDHYELDFDTVAKKDTKGATREYQFLNVGLGAHIQIILDLLDGQNIKYQFSDDFDENKPTDPQP